MSRNYSILLLLLAIIGVGGTTPFSPPAIAQKPDMPPAHQGKNYELRIIRVGNTFQAMRFMVGTGKSWIMAGDRFDKVPETGPVPAGNYDVQLVTDDKEWMAFRIDRNSGATWQLRGNKWHRVKEPPQKKDAIQQQPKTTNATWSDYGELRKLDMARDGQPLYGLSGKSGNLFLFVWSAKNAALDPYLEKTVSVYGPKASDPIWRAPIMTATHIALP